MQKDMLYYGTYAMARAAGLRENIPMYKSWGNDLGKLKDMNSDYVRKQNV